MGLIEVLDQNNVPYDKEEVIKRLDIFMKGLRRDPDYEEELKQFKGQKGGAIPIPVKPSKDDYLGPRLRWFVEVMGSPYAQGALRTLFMVLFFVSYLESIPAFGTILSTVLDLMLMATKMIIKTVQKALPPLVGLIPLPFSSFFGMGLAALFGMLVWPVVSIVSFSRQDFAAAIDAYLRMTPPPVGDMIADIFSEANRTVNRIDEKRKKLVSDITGGINSIVNLAKGTGKEVEQGAKTLVQKTQEAAKTVPRPTPEVVKQTTTNLTNKARKFIGGTRGQRFSKKKTRRSKWPKK
jgi:hypothetical protein